MCTEGLGRNQHELMTRAYWEFIVRLPNLFRQGYNLVECISVARVQPRTSKGITDLFLPQTSLRYTYTVPPRSNQIRTTPKTFQQAEAWLVNGINQTTSLHQLRVARHHNTQRREHERQRRRRNTAQHDATTQRHITQYPPHKTTTTNTTTTPHRSLGSRNVSFLEK